MPTTSRPRLRALCAAAALVLVLAACGGGDDDDADSTTTTEAEETTTTADDSSGDEDTDDTSGDDGGGIGGSDDDTDDTSADDDTDDADADAAALAEAVVLTADEFTDEWSSEASGPSETDIRECFTDFDDELLGDFTGEDFSREGTTTDSLSQIGSTGLVVTDADVAEGFVDEFATNAFAGCVQDQLGTALGPTLLDITLDPAPDAAPVADQAGALNGTITIASDDGTPIPGEISVWLIRTDQVLTGVTVAVFGEPDPGADVATLADETVSAVADKQATAVG